MSWWLLLLLWLLWAGAPLVRVGEVADPFRPGVKSENPNRMSVPPVRPNGVVGVTGVAMGDTERL